MRSMPRLLPVAVAATFSVASPAAVGVVSAVMSLASPAELLADADVPEPFELASDELRTQDFVEFTAVSPYSVGHVQPGSDEADDMVAGVDVWGFGTDETILREVARWSSGDVAGSYRREVAAYAAGDALSEIDPPFEGARAFSGLDPVQGVWTRMVVWSDGPYGAAITHFAAERDPSDSTINAAAKALRDEISKAVGTSSSPPTSEGGAGDGDESAGRSGSGGGISLVTVLLVVVGIGAAIWLFLRLRRRRAAASGRASVDADSGQTDTDDIIERARARARAREEVDAASEKWQMPDDY